MDHLHAHPLTLAVVDSGLISQNSDATFELEGTPEAILVAALVAILVAARQYNP